VKYAVLENFGTGKKFLTMDDEFGKTIVFFKNLVYHINEK